MALDALIFDVDGTLIDSNATHVEAFRLAFAGRGYKVAADRIAVEIGKGGDTLVPAILGPADDDRDGDAIRAAQPKHFQALAKRQGLRAFHAAAELLAAVRRRGVQVIIATSSGQKQVETLERLGGWAFTGAADAVVTADDAATSKPAPDLVAAAVARTGLSPAQCAMVGDTPYDARSAGGAGVVTLGVTCGGNAAEVLLAAGVRRVYRDPAELLAKLDEALAVASPTAAHLTRSTLDFLMGQALDAARVGLADGQRPVGCVLARGDGSVVARGWDQVARTGDPTAHAVRVTLSAAAGHVPIGAADLVLVTTVQPCVMCAGATMMAGVDTVVFGPTAADTGGTGRVTPPVGPSVQMPRFVGGVRSTECLDLLRQWVDQHPDATGATQVRRTLSQHAAG